MAEPETAPTTHLLLPVLSLRDSCLFPEASMVQVLLRPGSVKALEVALRTGARLLALGQRELGAAIPQARDMHGFGTVARVSEDLELPDGSRRVELDGVERARVVTLLGNDPLVAEVEPIAEVDSGDEWGAAVEALARYLHAHPDLRSFLDQQRRSNHAMSWVNLACQHLPIAASARQRLLEADAAERCRKISRGLDALLRKEKGD
jgi:ATP-dependent Lon protease